MGLFRLIGLFDTAAIAVLSTVTSFHSLSSRVGCSFQGKLLSIFTEIALLLFS